MATPINAPMAGEIWHLSIEDLFQPVQEAPRLGGDGPFVINLSVSTAPISVPTKAFTHSPLDAHVYQIQVTEDGRTRYRLRLGPFASEDEADAILAEVRDTYPGALTATASGSDMRVIASMQAKADQRAAAAKPADLVIEKSVSKKIAAEKATQEKVAQEAAPEKSTHEKATHEKVAAKRFAPEAAERAAPQKAAVRESAVTVKPEVPEISIDIAWPTPELGVPPSMPQRAAPPTSAPAPQWELPELDVLLPTIQRQPAAAIVPTAAIAPVAEATAPAPAPQPFELKLAPPYSAASAPVLTEVVTRKSPAPKTAAPTPAVIAAPVLTDAVAPKTKAPPAPAPAAPAPVIIAAAPAPFKAPPKRETAPPSKPEMAAPPKHEVAPPFTLEMAPPPKQELAPPFTLEMAAPAKQEAAPASKLEIAPAQEAAVTSKPETTPPSKQEMAPPPKSAIVPPPKQKMTPPPPKAAAPKSPAAVEAPKAAPVVTQSVATTRRGWPKFRMSSNKPAANKLTSLQHVVVATAPVPAPREVKKLDEPLESLESTQTIRALTPKELEDNEASRWFVIQLALADHAFDPDAVPNLDIFSEYRLYSVAGLDQGRVVHALRLGFFREEIGAVAVASYLATFWDKPTIKRVSLAERERFAEQRVEARKDVGATGKHAVIEITDELVARRRRSTKAMAVKTANRPIEH
jgi:SPOR domain